MSEPNFKTSQWIAWMAATLVACVALTSFAYQNFQTKDDAKQHKEEIIRRLERIEDAVMTIRKDVKNL